MPILETGVSFKSDGRISFNLFAVGLGSQDAAIAAAATLGLK